MYTCSPPSLSLSSPVCNSHTTTEDKTLMDTSLLQVSLLLFLLWNVRAADSDGEVQIASCISRYPVFEEVAITNNSDNTYALFSTLYSPNQPLPYSIVILYQVLLPDGTLRRLSSDPNCPSELWLWTYSPVFMLFEPSLLNKMTYYALNNLQPWTSPTVTLTVPQPCPNVTFKFLSEMTMAVNNYALGGVDQKKNLGFVLHCCGTKAENCILYPSSSHGNEMAWRNKISGLRWAFTFSTLLQIIFVCLGTSMLLQIWMPKVMKKSQNRPSQTYGTFWAVTTTASTFFLLSTAADLYLFAITVTYHPYVSSTALAVIIFSIIIQMPIALYFGRKYTIAVPCIYLAPARLACCGRKRLAAALVRVVFLQMTLTAMQLVSTHGTALILAFGAAPFVISANIVMAVFCFFCVVQILAILFTLPGLWPQLGAHSREKSWVVLQGVSIVILLIAMFLYTLVVVAAGYIINISTEQESFLFAVSKVALPLGLCLTCVLLKKLSTLWWQKMLAKKNEEEMNQHLIGYNTI